MNKRQKKKHLKKLGIYPTQKIVMSICGRLLKGQPASPLTWVHKGNYMPESNAMSAFGSFDPKTVGRFASLKSIRS